MSGSDLFDPAFLTSLEALRLVARRVPAGGRHGEQRSAARGMGIEFTDVRPYTPGDDFRAIDWHVFQRLDKLFLRLYLEEQDLPVYFLIDQSRSMSLPGPGGAERRRTALQAVAALSYVALQHLDRVAIFPFAGEELAPLPGTSGRAGFQRVLDYLERLPQGTETRLSEALTRFAHRRLRRGLLVLVSDYLDPRGPDAWLPVLSAIPHRPLLLRTALVGEDRPALRGPIEVVDCETGTTLALEADDALVARYAQAHAAFVRQLEDFCRGRGAGMLHLVAGLPTVPQLARLFTQGVLTA